ncbi:PREDICTED: phosphatidylglycerol/phosphatidylinositol transfer protein-like [Amphimedon queenslandica]|uniref:MD-2-related lipid-recognition domain-containing protein n=1 Tax=Amphimedon queenslandica TaxID=400682 RepID=A0AAN0J646_AMPQE|nr:PREDICTED: phosphatidylglycerol/phosphatidylinositol transfer protein-like [Amphimedon queenslandica]|eukprot:XP_019852227.1 PREDICTED: phosphatidylglycerol/phosphatidylinositol transfer protein-like [Amphimedon queenslandica]
MGRLVEYILLLLSVVLVISTLTGSANNYYNEEPIKFTDCSVTKKFAELTNASLTPYPLIRGRRFHWKAKIHIKKTIKWAILHLTLKTSFKNFTNITFVDEKFNFCDLCVQYIKEYCPIQPGIYNYRYSDTPSHLLWPGQYNFKVTVYNQEGEQIFCGTKEVKLN